MNQILFLKARDRSDTGTGDMFGTHLETRTRKDGVVQAYHVASSVAQKQQASEKMIIFPSKPNKDSSKKSNIKPVANKQGDDVDDFEDEDAKYYREKDEAEQKSRASADAIDAFMKGKRLPKGWTKRRDEDDDYFEHKYGDSVHKLKAHFVNILPPGGVFAEDDFMIIPAVDEAGKPNGKFQILYSDGGNVGQPVTDFTEAMAAIQAAQAKL